MMLFLLGLTGCTWVFRNDTCDTNAPALEVESLWASRSADWQMPAVGTEFVCAFQQGEEAGVELPRLDQLACFGPTAGSLLDAISGSEAGDRQVKELSAGGGILCAQLASETGGPTDVECWGDGAEAAMRGLEELLDEQEDATVDVGVAPGEDHICAVINPNQGADGQRYVTCHGAGPVLDAFNEPATAAALAGEAFSFVQTSQTLACGRSDGRTGGPPATQFVCWGESPPVIDPAMQSDCWSAFDVSNGVLCANRRADDPLAADDSCAQLPPVQCWGDATNPIISRLPDLLAQIDPAAIPPQLRLGPDYGCVHYDDAIGSRADIIACWGASDSPVLANPPSGRRWSWPKTGSEARHGCALDLADAASDAPAGDLAIGRLTCWGDDLDGALALD